MSTRSAAATLDAGESWVKRPRGICVIIVRGAAQIDLTCRAILALSCQPPLTVGVKNAESHDYALASS